MALNPAISDWSGQVVWLVGLVLVLLMLGGVWNYQQLLQQRQHVSRVVGNLITLRVFQPIALAASGNVRFGADSIEQFGGEAVGIARHTAQCAVSIRGQRGDTDPRAIPQNLRGRLGHNPGRAKAALDDAVITAPDEHDPALMAKLDAVAGRLFR